MKSKHDVTKAAEFLRYEEHGRQASLFGKPYVWVIEAGRLRLVRPDSLPRVKM